MNKQLLTKILIVIGGLVVLGLIINLLVSADQPPTLPKVTCGLTPNQTSVAPGGTIAFHPDCRANFSDMVTTNWRYNTTDENGVAIPAKSAVSGNISFNGGPDEKANVPTLFVDIPANLESNQIKVQLNIGSFISKEASATIVHNPYLQLKKGYNIVYLPYSLKNADKKTSDFIASLSSKNNQVVNWIRRWDGQLQTWFDAAQTASVASPLGKGLYVYAKQDIARIDINDMFSLIDENQSITVPVYKGWNLVGNPYFRYSPTLANMTVKINGQAVDWIKATNDIDIYMMWEKGNIGSFELAGVTYSGPSPSLNRFEGFWIKMPEAGEIIWNKSGTPPTLPIQEDNGSPTTEENTDVTVTQNSDLTIGNLTAVKVLNGSNKGVSIDYNISTNALVTMKIYKKATSVLVRTLVNNVNKTGGGTYTEKWDVKGDHPNGGGTFVDLSADTYKIELAAKKDQNSTPVTRTTDITLSLNDMISIRN